MEHTFSFELEQDFEDCPLENLEQFVKGQLNYGWEFVRFVYGKNSERPTRVILNFRREGTPDIPPFGRIPS